MSNRKEQKGLYFNPITFNLIFRPIASLLGGVVVTGFIWLLQNLPNMIGFLLLTASVIDEGVYQAIRANSLKFVNPGNAPVFSLLFSILFALPDRKEPESVPVSHAAVMTILGIPLRIYRVNGDYSWTGKWLFLGRTRVMSLPFANKDGFVFLDIAPIAIWNNAQDKDKIMLSSIAKDGSTIFTNLLLNVKLFDPIRWVQTQNPLLMVAERARAGFRTAISFFTGSDNAEIKSVLRKLMTGEEIVTCFLQKTVGEHKAGSMMRDQAGVAVYVRVNDYEDKEKKTARQKAKKGLRKLINNNLSKDMRDAILDKNGKPFIESRSVEETMGEVLKSVGAMIADASVGDISFSTEVEKQANLAAGEEYQATARRASAESTAEAQEILAKQQEENRADDLSRVIAAAQDNPDSIRIVLVPGGDNLSKAAVAATSQLQGKGK